VQKKDNKIILFPNLKIDLKKTAQEEYQNKNFKEALEIYEELIKYKEADHDVNFGKLLCLIELQLFNEAQDFCEQQLIEENKLYYDYMHLYVTILFQTEQYELLLDCLTYELMKESLPAHLQDQFQYLFEVSKEMTNHKRAFEKKKLLKQFDESIEKNDPMLQNHILDLIIEKEIKASPRIATLLSQDSIHPIIKTKLFYWLQNNLINSDVKVKKFNLIVTLNPNETPKLEENDSFLLAQKHISKNYDEDPVLARMIKELAFRYFYVLYPILPRKKDLQMVLSVMEKLVRKGLYNEDLNERNKEQVEMAEMIMKIEAIYLSLIG